MLDELLGRGPSGEVWRASSRDGERAAIKLVRRALLADPASVARFVGDQTVVAGLAHEHIVRVHDLVIDCEEQTLAVVMDLPAGGSLQQRLALGPMSQADALLVASQVAAALVRAHGAGVVHGGIKPENVLLDRHVTGARAMLTDFGAAALAGAEPAALTPAGDVHALGALLDGLLGGAPPTGDEPVQLDVPPVVRSLVAQMLTAQPDDRPPAAALVQPLAAAARLARRVGHDEPSRRAPLAQRAIASAAMGCAGLAFAFLLAAALPSGDSRDGPSSETAAPPRTDHTAPAPADTLAALRIDLPTSALGVGARMRVAVTATSVEGSPVPAELLAVAEWSTDRPSIATVAGGELRGHQPGTAIVSVRVLGRSASAVVTVVSQQPAVTGSAPPTTATTSAATSTTTGGQARATTTAAPPVAVTVTTTVTASTPPPEPSAAVAPVTASSTTTPPPSTTATTAVILVPPPL